MPYKRGYQKQNKIKSIKKHEVKILKAVSRLREIGFIK